MSSSMSASISIDEAGRVEPSRNLKAGAHSISRNYFQFPVSNVDLTASHQLLECAFPKVVNAEVFKEKAEALYKKARKLLGLKQSIPLVHAPFFLPKMQHEDLGVEAEKVYFPAINSAYNTKFPEYDFTVEYKESLEGKIQSIAGLGHDRLEKMAREADVIGVTMLILREYSVQAAREQMDALPPDFSLAGILDVSAVLVSRPDLMFNTERYAPMIWTSGCQTLWEHANFHFEGYGYNLMFNRRVHHDLVAEYWSHGISLFENI